MLSRPLRELPKAHLHAHLDGSYPLAAVRELAQRQGIQFEVPDSFASAKDFFREYSRVPAMVREPGDLEALCAALVRAEAAEHVRYLEVAIEPQLFPHLGSIDEVGELMLATLAEAGRANRVEVGSMVTINTDLDAGIAHELVALAVRAAGSGVVSLGTAGFGEPDFERFAGAAQAARSAGLSVVSHAGETSGPQAIVDAIEVLGASRIGHGIRAVEDDRVVEMLVRQRVVCDVCPVSNLALRLIEDLAHHPAPQLISAGVPVTLNADDSLWFSAGITEQYEVARETWGFDDTQLARIAANGALAAGMSESTRSALLADIETWLAAAPVPSATDKENPR